MRYFILTTLLTFIAGLGGQALAQGPAVPGQVPGSTYGNSNTTRPELRQKQETPGSQPAQLGQNANQGQQQAVAQQLSSERVRLIQENLKDRGFNPGPIDGIMGPNTRQAIRDFQLSQGLAVSGRPNQQTLRALNVQKREFIGVAPAYGEQTSGMATSGQQQNLSKQQNRSQQQVASQQLSSPDIRALQKSLKDRGYNVGPVDGKLGPKTREAVKDFQLSQGFAATGRPDQQTFKALNIETHEYTGVSPTFGGQQQQKNQQTPQNQKEQQNQKQGQQKSNY